MAASTKTIGEVADLLISFIPEYDKRKELLEALYKIEGNKSFKDTITKLRLMNMKKA